MNTPTKFRSTLFFLGLPVLWLGSISATGQFSSAQQSANFEFVPVAIHATHSANYSVDASSDKFSPVDPDIVDDAMSDQGMSPPTTPLIQVSPVVDHANGVGDPQDQDAHRGVQPTPDSTPEIPRDSEDPGQSGEVHGQSGEDNGNQDKDESSPGQSGEEHGGGNSGGSGGGSNHVPPPKDKDKDK